MEESKKRSTDELCRDSKDKKRRTNELQQKSQEKPGKTEPLSSEKEDYDKLQLQKVEKKHFVSVQTLKQLKDYYDKQKKKIQEITGCIQDLELANNDKTDTFNVLCSYDNRLQKNVSDIKKRYNVQREALENVQKMFYEIHFGQKFDAKEGQELMKLYQMRQNEIVEIEGHNKKFAERRDKLKTHCEQKMNSAEVEKNTLRKHLDEIDVDVTIKCEVVAQLKQALFEQEKKSQNLEQDKELEELTNVLMKLKVDQNSLIEKLHTVDSNKNQLSNDLSSLESSLSEKMDTINLLTNEMPEKEHKNQMLREKIDKLRIDFDKQIKELTLLKQILIERETMENKLTEEMKLLMQSNTANCDEVEKMKNLLQFKKDELSSLSKELKCQEELETKQLAKLESLRTKLEKYEEDNTIIVNHLNKAKQSGQSKNDQLEEVKLKMQNLKSEVEIRHAENEKMQKEKEKLLKMKNQEVKKMEEESENLKSSLMKSEEMINDLTAEIKKFEKEKKEICTKVIEVEKKTKLATELRDKLKDDLRVGEQTNRKMRNELKPLMELSMCFTNEVTASNSRNNLAINKTKPEAQKDEINPKHWDQLSSDDKFEYLMSLPLTKSNKKEVITKENPKNLFSFNKQ